MLRGYGWTPLFVEGHEPALMHEAMAATLDTAVEQIKKIQQDARVAATLTSRWPTIAPVLVQEFRRRARTSEETASAGVAIVSENPCMSV